MSTQMWWAIGISMLLLPATWLVLTVPAIGAGFGLIAGAIWVVAMGRAVRQGLDEQRRERQLRSRL